MSKIYTPTKSTECWRDGLADPVKHWRTGYSARAMAHAWEDQNGMPRRIRKAIETEFSGEIEPLMVIPEYKVPMPGRGADSQNDAFVLARIGNKTATIMIEGKVNESFDITIEKWLAGGSGNSRYRLNSICKILGIETDPNPALRYQLFHRTASAIIAAQKFKTDLAIMLVHSFSQDHKWFGDYAAFADALGVTQAARGQVQKTTCNAASPLYLGWVTGEARYLEM